VDAPVAHPRRHRLPRSGRDAARDGPSPDQPPDRRPAREAGGRGAAAGHAAQGRADEFTAALVGYTNAGKSSILRSLSGAELFVEDRLFATLDPSTRAVELEPGMKVLVTDTVGFIRKLPHHLVASFSATLEEAMTADVLLHAIDASHAGWEEQKEVVEDVLEQLGLAERPTVLVFNKIDRLTHGEEQALRSACGALFENESSSRRPWRRTGLDELRAVLLRRCGSSGRRCRLEIPYSTARRSPRCTARARCCAWTRTAAAASRWSRGCRCDARPAAQPRGHRGGGRRP
jgi:50S ribosomal subunit-associated GTPase HflX